MPRALRGKRIKAAAIRDAAGNLNAGQRMRLAGRIAAATILGNRFAVWTGPEVDCPH